MSFLQPKHRRLLSGLNPLFLVGGVFILLLAKTSGGPMLGYFSQWDLLLPAVIYFGQRRSLPEGLVLTLFCSHLYSLCSAAPIGVFATYYLTLFMVARLVSYVFYADTWISIGLLILSLSLLSRLLLPLVATSFGHGWHVLSFANFGVLKLLLGTILGNIVYRLLEQLDVLTFKTSVANIQLMERDL